MCAPPTAHTSQTGLRPTNRVAGTGSRPSAVAQRQTSARHAPAARAVTALSTQNAAGTPSGDRAAVASVKSGPYGLGTWCQPTNGNTGSVGAAAEPYA